MARSIFQILDDLVAGLDELRDALSPLAALSGGSRASAAPAARPAPRRGRPAKGSAKAAAPAADAAPKRRGRPPKEKSAAPAGPRKTASAELSDARALQGRYMGTLRHLTKAQQEQVRGVRSERGVEAAIELAKRLAAGS